MEVELSQRCAGRKAENAVLQGDVVRRGDFEGSVNDRQQLSDGSSVEAQAQLTSGGTWQPLGLPTRPCPTTTPWPSSLATGFKQHVNINLPIIFAERCKWTQTIIGLDFRFSSRTRPDGQDTHHILSMSRDSLRNKEILSRFLPTFWSR